MRHIDRILLSFICLLLALPSLASAANLNLKNASTTATFDQKGLRLVRDVVSGASVGFDTDNWSITLDGITLRSEDSTPQVKKNCPQ